MYEIGISSDFFFDIYLHAKNQHDPHARPHLLVQSQQWKHGFGVYIVNFEQFSRFFLMFPLNK